MPRFYFDVREGARFVPDDEGLEFPGLDAAEREAAEAVASIGRDLLPKGDACEVTIEVRNEHRQRVLSVTVAMHLERVHPSPVGQELRGTLFPSTRSNALSASSAVSLKAKPLPRMALGRGTAPPPVHCRRS